jgi:hypothetical protein
MGGVRCPIANVVKNASPGLHMLGAICVQKCQSKPFKIDKINTVKTVDCKEKGDDINHPKHYTSHPSGVECITITRHHNFAIGNAIKYLFRAGLKHPSPVEDLKKAIWYIQDEIKRIEK